MGRISLELDQSKTIAKLRATAATNAEDKPLLRIYWYDGVVGGRLSTEQQELSITPDVKFRPGVVNSAGQQKGVDSLIVTDLIELARNHAISDAVLLSGDGDLRIGVQIAQSFGVRVHLVSIEPGWEQSRSQLLWQESDTATQWSRADIGELLTLKPGFNASDWAIGSTSGSAIVSETVTDLNQAVTDFFSTLNPQELLDIARFC